MIEFYFEWLSIESNIVCFLVTNFILAISIFIVVFIGDQIIDYIYLKEDIKELKEKVKKIEKRKKR